MRLTVILADSKWSDVQPGELWVCIKQREGAPAIASATFSVTPEGMDEAWQFARHIVDREQQKQTLQHPEKVA